MKTILILLFPIFSFAQTLSWNEPKDADKHKGIGYKIYWEMVDSCSTQLKDLTYSVKLGRVTKHSFFLDENFQGGRTYFVRMTSYSDYGEAQQSDEYKCIKVKGLEDVKGLELDDITKEIEEIENEIHQFDSLSSDYEPYSKDRYLSLVGSHPGKQADSGRVQRIPRGKQHVDNKQDRRRKGIKTRSAGFLPVKLNSKRVPRRPELLLASHGIPNGELKSGGKPSKPRIMSGASYRNPKGSGNSSNLPGLIFLILIVLSGIGVGIYFIVRHNRKD